MAQIAQKCRQWVNASLPKSRISFECSLGEIKFKYETGQGDAFYGLNKSRNLDTFESGSLLYWCHKASQSSLVIDVGAYTGIYSVVAAKVGASVVSIEPNIHIFGDLKRNLQLNNLNTIAAHNCALGAREEIGKLLAPKLKFHRRPQFKGSGIQLNIAETGRDLTGWKEIGEIEINTLDRLVSKDDYPKIGIIKIDAEGSEFDILSGSRELIQFTHSEFLIECLDFESLNKVNNFMLKNGFYIKKVFGKNYLFIKATGSGY